MNDINIVSNTFKSILFADDTSLNSVISLFKTQNSTQGISDHINQELAKITDWLRANKLSLNVSKTKYMLFRYPQTSLNSLPILNLKMDGSQIEKVDCFNQAKEVPI